MIRVKKALVVAVVAALGLWGCARGPAGNGNASGEKAKALEQKVSKLEEDFRVAATARDQARQRLTALEEQRAQLEKEMTRLKGAVKERDDLRQQVAVRTTERDALQSQYDQFRKAIRDLVGQAEAASAPSLSQPPTATLAVTTREKS
jgi:chromosome segregation ATPase